MPNLLEKIPVQIFPDEGNHIAVEIANVITRTIKYNNTASKNTVIGLATGNTPLNIYRELIRLHKKGNLDFSRVITFNLDEYYGLDPEHINSYHKFMWENLFNYINIKKENVHIPDGTVKRDKILQYCLSYEQDIENAGGIDIQLLGIGRDGHIGFNEPYSLIDSKTRLVRLDEVTRTDVLPDFGERKYVPQEAITVGVATILKARQIIVIATGNHKAQIVRETVEGKVTEKIAASYLQKHHNTTMLLDRAAASELTRIKTPWVIREVNWKNEHIRVKAVCYLSEHLQRPILKLETQDFLKNSLGPLIRKYPVEKVKKEAFNKIKNKIKNFSELPKKKKILVFSPHPDDDIISMGGTLQKLVKNKNAIHIVYMTPGYTAVFDHEVVNFITARKKFADSFNIRDPSQLLYKKILDFLNKKQKSDHGMVDIPEVLEIKKVIRQVEAISACDFINVNSYEFITLPFYQTGRARKMPVGEQDIEIIRTILEKNSPDIIFAAGDLSDPNGTHRLCLSIIRTVLKKLQNKPELWLYNGAWNEFHPSEASIIIPLTPEEINLKREGIFRHESQNNPPKVYNISGFVYTEDEIVMQTPDFIWIQKESKASEGYQEYPFLPYSQEALPLPVYWEYLPLPLDTIMKKASDLCRLCNDGTLCDDPDKQIMKQDEFIYEWDAHKQKEVAVSGGTCEFIVNGWVDDIWLDPGRVYKVAVKPKEFSITLP